MTTTSWTTTAEVPPTAWAPMAADMRRLLTVTTASGATVTGPTDGAPQLDDDHIAFTVVASTAGSAELTIAFARTADTGEAATTSPLTGGLVLATMRRAAKHWGALLNWTTDADVATHAVADTLIEGLFGADDRAVAGLDAPASQQGAVSELVTASLGRVFHAVPDTAPLPTLLTAVIADLTAVSRGVVAARQLLDTPRSAS